MAQPQLEMERTSLEELPALAQPPGYSLRAYQPGDAAAWCRLVNEGIGGEWTEERFQAETARALDFQPADLIFALADREVTGTAWALRLPDSPRDLGWVHMVAVAAGCRGRGLGRALVLATLRRFQELGLARAVLKTDDFRLPAIRVYLGLGFRPVLSHESHPARWRQIYDKLGRDKEELTGEALSPT
jgi:mycothiol synthase